MPKMTAKNSASSSAGNATATLMTEVMNRPGAAADDQRGGAEQQAAADADGGRGEGEADRQPGGDEDPVEDVLAEVVGAEPVPGRRALQDA